MQKISIGMEVYEIKNNCFYIIFTFHTVIPRHAESYFAASAVSLSPAHSGDHTLPVGAAAWLW